MIANGVDVPDAKVAAAEGRKTNGRKTALFLGRIHPKKGLLMLVEAWARVRPDGWQLQIAGPDETGHRVQVENAISAAGLSEIVSFLGPIYGKRKDLIFSNSDLFVLSDSFGKFRHGYYGSTCARSAGSHDDWRAMVNASTARLWLVG